MKLEYIIKNIVQNNKIKTQNELADLLSQKGINATQSNISRILKKLNTVKIVDDNSEAYYVIYDKPLELTEWIKNIIINIEDNGHNISLKVYPGSADLIAKIIKEREVENVIAVMSSYDNLLIVPKNIEFISNIVKKLKNIFFIKDF